MNVFWRDQPVEGTGVKASNAAAPEVVLTCSITPLSRERALSANSTRVWSPLAFATSRRVFRSIT